MFEALVAWRAGLDFDGPVFAGVLVLASSKMARNTTSTVACPATAR